MTDLAVRQSPTMPSNEWLLIQHQANALAQSDIIPVAYRRKPANIIAAAMTGRHWGWDVMASMRNGHVIDGTWGMKPEAMLGLVRQAGHSVQIELFGDGAKVTGKRADNGDTMIVDFRFADAELAGLIKLRDGKPYARSKSGNPLPWEQYPVTMCQWRAVALLCRSLFGDLTAGVHSAEEIGGVLTAEGDIGVEDSEVVEDAVIVSDEPQPLSSTALEAFENACHTEGLDANDVLIEAFGNDLPDPLTDIHLPAMRDAFRRLVEQNAATPPEARPASRNQVGKIKGEYTRLNMGDRDQQLQATASIVGRPIDSHNNLTYDEATLVIDALTNTPDPPEDEQ